jgi:hypothetical protein
MERQVFISYAAGDPDWTEEQVLALATVIRQAGPVVHLDVWHQQRMLRNLADDEWREWMETSLERATNVVCLSSPRYCERWARKLEDKGGFGVAFESVRIVHELYYQKQRNRGWILTLRHAHAGTDCIPKDLAHNCPKYRWNQDVEALIQHLTKANVRAPREVDPSPAVSPAADAPQDTATPLDRNLLQHQADHAISRLQAAPDYWSELRRSENLADWLPANGLETPRQFVRALEQLPEDRYPQVLQELREVFGDTREGRTDAVVNDAAEATVACYVYCACLSIKVDLGSATVGLPKHVANRDAARLLASLIALVMAGGRLELTHGGQGLPQGSGTYVLQLQGEDEEADFERQLYAMLVLNPWSAPAGQKIGALSPNERDELLVTLKELRGDGRRTRVILFVIESETKPVNARFELAQSIRVPVFHAHEKVAHRLLGMSEGELVTHLHKLWTKVSASLTSAQTNNGEKAPSLEDVLRELRALAQVVQEQTASRQLRAAAETLQRDADSDQPPARDVLVKTRDTLEGLSGVGDAAEKIAARLLQLLNFFLS